MSAEVNADEFAAELWQEALVLHKGIKQGIAYFAELLFSKILDRTPFRTGYLLANWQIGGKASIRSRRVKFRGRYQKYSITRTGARNVALNSLKAFIAGLQDPYQAIDIVNNAPYAEFVHGKEGPYLSDLVALSVAEVEPLSVEVEL